MSLVNTFMIAAIQGGAYPPEANWIADRALRRLNTFDGLDELVPIAYDAGLELCELVAASKRTDTGNFYVEQAKRYLSTHLTQGIHVPEVADAIGLPPPPPTSADCSSALPDTRCAPTSLPSASRQPSICL